MPENEKLVIELELEGRKFQKELANQLKSMNKWARESAKGTKDIIKALEEIKDVLKGLAKGYKDVGSVAQEAGKKQVRAAKQITVELKNHESTLRKIKKFSDPRGGATAGFIGGLAKGTGVAGILKSLTGPDKAARLGGAIGRGTVGLGARGIGFGISGLQNAFQVFQQYGMSLNAMSGMGFSRAQFNRSSRGATRLGFSPTQTAGQGAAAARATGASSVGIAQRLALAGGFGPGGVGEATEFMGTMRQAGSSFQGAANQAARKKDLVKTLALGTASGLEKARLPEFFAGVGQLVRSQFATTAGKVDANVIAKQLAQLGASGKAGFQGARGAQVMGKLDAMIRTPGGGEAGQAMILQAMGFGKPGGTTNYYDAVKKQQEGIRDPTNIKAVMEEVYKQYGNVAASGKDPSNREANMIFSEMSNMSLRDTEDLKDTYLNTALSQAERDKKVQEILDRSESIDKQALKATQGGFTDMAKRLAGIEATQITIGGRSSKLFMGLQDLQLKALDYISKYIPDIVNWLEKIWKQITGFWADAANKFGETGVEEQLKRITEVSDTKINKLYNLKTYTAEGELKRQSEIANELERKDAITAAVNLSSQSRTVGGLLNKAFNPLASIADPEMLKAIGTGRSGEVANIRKGVAGTRQAMYGEGSGGEEQDFWGSTEGQTAASRLNAAVRSGDPQQMKLAMTVKEKAYQQWGDQRRLARSAAAMGAHPMGLTAKAAMGAFSKEFDKSTQAVMYEPMEARVVGAKVSGSTRRSGATSVSPERLK